MFLLLLSPAIQIVAIAWADLQNGFALKAVSFLENGQCVSQNISLPNYHFARRFFCQNIMLPKYCDANFWKLSFAKYQFSTICSQINGPKSSQNNNLGHPQTQHFVQSRGVMVPVEPSSPVIANRTFCKYQSGPRVMVPLEPSSFVSFGQPFIQFLESSWRSTESSWCLERLQGVMVPVEPSSLRSDLVEPTKDDPEMQQRDTNSKLSTNLRKTFGNLIFCKTKL